MLAFIGYTPDWLNANWAKFEAGLAAAPVTLEAQAVVAERIAALLAFDRSKDIGGIELPTFIQGAADDLIVPAFLQRELAELMPRAELQMLDSGGHFYPVTRTPVFVEMLLNWADAND
jgi:pimeloyl-ACP methyl ester carboxylesterase